MTNQLQKCARASRPRTAISAFLLVLCCVTIAGMQSARASVYESTVTSSAGLRNDYYRGSWYSTDPSDVSSVWIGGLDCYGGCSWSGEKTFNELFLPAITGNIISATFFLNVVDGSGDAWLNTPNLTGLTGDAAADYGLVPWQFQNSGIRIGPGAAGWVALDVTAGVQNDYLAGVNWAEFMLDPPPWSTSLVYSPAGTEFAPYLVIVTDAPDAPEPASLALFGAGVAGVEFLRRRRNPACRLAG